MNTFKFPEPIFNEDSAIMEFHCSEDWAGPASEIDKLMSVDWAKVSQARDGGDAISFLSAKRTGPCSMVVESVSYEELPI